MNFLLHHALARAELGCGVTAIGAMLPDLWRMAGARWRLRSGVARGDGSDRVMRLARGIDHHLEADRWFHRCEVFVEGERATAAALAAIGAPKLALFGHIAWELCLDGALVKQGADAIARDIAAGLASAGSAEASIAERHGVGRLDAEARERFERNMRAIRGGLTDGSWIGGYASGEGLGERLEGMRVRRLGLAPLGATRRHALALVLAERLRHADEALGRLLELRAGFVRCDGASTSREDSRSAPR